MVKYPIDSKENQLAFGYWLGKMLGIIQASLSISSRDLDLAKFVFSEGLENLFPKGNTRLNSIKIHDLVVNLDKSKEDRIWKVFSRLLELWMDLQEETLPGVSELKSITKQEFINLLRLAKHQLGQL